MLNITHNMIIEKLIETNKSIIAHIINSNTPEGQVIETTAVQDSYYVTIKVKIPLELYDDNENT